MSKLVQIKLSPPRLVVDRKPLPAVTWSGMKQPPERGDSSSLPGPSPAEAQREAEASLPPDYVI